LFVDVVLGQEKKQVEEEWKDLTEWLKTQLKDRVRKVAVSKRLTKSMSALVAGSYGLTANMERIVKSQALGDQDPSLQYQPKPVLEINVNHPVLKVCSRVGLFGAWFTMFVRRCARELRRKRRIRMRLQWIRLSCFTKAVQ
jgi:hypothetical protein